jgi:glycerophosphoryl diester phosphodiesterase
MAPQAFAVSAHVYAHRGFWWGRGGPPENSVGAFRTAAKARLGVELDVRMTRDGALAVFHDATLERMCGSNAHVSNLTAREIKQHRLPDGSTIPLLDEVLDVMQEHPVLIELKVEENAADLAGLVGREIRGLLQPIAAMSFDEAAVRHLRQLVPDRSVGQLIEPIRQIGRDEVVAKVLRAVRNCCDYLAPHTTSHPATHNTAPNLPRVAWTVKALIQLQLARRRGAAPIFEGFSPAVALRSMNPI